MDADPIEASKLFAELAEKGHPFAQVPGLDFRQY